MRCEEVRFRFEETWPEALSEAVREHLAGCAGCRAYTQDWRLARAGFLALAEEAVPEPSLGFVTRALRRLDESFQPAEFLELAGRRMVFAGMLLALMLLLALALPASGPLRGTAIEELSAPQPEVIAYGNEPVLMDDVSDVPRPGPQNPALGTQRRRQ